MAKRKSSDDLPRFCSACHAQSELALSPPPNVFCWNRECAEYGKKQHGLFAELQTGELTADEITISGTDTTVLEQKVKTHKDEIKQLIADQNEILIKKRQKSEWLDSAERELKLRSINAMRSKIDTTNDFPSVQTNHAVLAEMISMLREYHRLFLSYSHSFSNVKYGRVSVTFQQSSDNNDGMMKLETDGQLFCNEVYCCNVVSDHPRDWGL